MSLTGPPKATFLYPRFKTTTVTIDIPEPAMILAAPAPTVGLVGQNRVASGKTETLFGRLEDSCGLGLRCEPDILQALRWLCEDTTFRGTQFQAWIDRFTGSCWMFENNLKDQNGLALALDSGSATYAVASTGTGIVITTHYLTVPVAQASAATPTGYDDPFSKDEGVLVVDFKPTWAASDNSVPRQIVDTPNGANRLGLFKNTSTQLAFQIVDGTSTAKQVLGTVAWNASDRVQAVASWDATGTLALYYAVNGGSFTQLTGSAFSGTGILSALPTTLYIGTSSVSPASNVCPGTYDTVAFFKKAFTSPHLSLASYRPWRRNYFAYAEPLGFQFAPTRVTLGRQYYDWQIAFRNGQP